MSNQLSHEVVAAGGKLAPAAVVVTSDAVARKFFGMSLQDWVYVATLLYLGFQMVVIMPKVLTTWRGWLGKLRATVKGWFGRVKGWFNRGN